MVAKVGMWFVMAAAVKLIQTRQEWVEQPVGVAVNPGEEAVLSCRLLGKKGDCRWERNGLPVGLYHGKYEWAGIPSQGDCSLRLREASMQYDQGDWVCQVTASSFMEKDTLISSPARLIVRDPPGGVELRVLGVSDPAGPVSGVAGQERVVECAAKGGSPPPNILWSLGNSPLQPTTTPTTDAAGNTVSVMRLTLMREDHGKSLRCELEHPALLTTMNIKTFLDIQYAPRVTVGDSSPVSLSGLMEGASLRVSCLVDANPRADVLWYRDGSGEIVSRVGEMRLERVDRATAGRYFCQANNSVGASQPAEVIVGVQYGPEIVSVGPGERVDRQLRGRVVLTCEAEANPPPHYQWVQHTDTGPVVRGDERSLVLDGVMYSDEGSYECTAYNYIGDRKHSARGRPVQVNIFGAPRIVNRVESAESFLEAGPGAGHVRVEFCSDPPPRQIWHVDSGPGQKIVLEAGTAHERFAVSRAVPAAAGGPDCFVSTLVISEPAANDDRDYVLHLENEHGLEQHSVHVHIGSRGRLSSEAVTGAVLGGGFTLLALVVAIFWICRRCCNCCDSDGDSKEFKLDQESTSSGEKWSTGSQVSETSTGTHNTSHSVLSTGTHNTSHSALSTGTHNTSHSALSTGTDHTCLTQDTVHMHCEKKNISFSEPLSVSQECLRRDENTSRTASTTATAAAAVVSYNDLCFPKISNYGSMRKAGRCDIATMRSHRAPAQHALQATNAEYVYT